jgi:hypothetical protein
MKHVDKLSSLKLNGCFLPFIRTKPDNWRMHSYKLLGRNFGGFPEKRNLSGKHICTNHPEILGWV